MGGLSLENQHHQPNGMGMGRSAYIPPHMRGQMDGPAPGPPAMNGNLNGGNMGGAPRYVAAQDVLYVLVVARINVLH